jgi:hypothetical protein
VNGSEPRLPIIPMRLVHRLWGPWAALGIIPDPWHYHGANMTRSAILAYHALGQSDITVPELVELGTTFVGEGILCEELGARLLEVAARLPVPWLSIAGSRDWQCPVETARWTYDRVQAPRKEWLVCARGACFARDYGHFDLVAGRSAHEEVWPRVEAFLETCPA